jgi:gliding motility-associated-like protein
MTTPKPASALFQNTCRAVTLLFAVFGTIQFVSAQSPTCDIPGIMAAFTGAGYVPLNVQGQPCSLYFVNPTSQTAGQAQAAAAALGANLVVMNDAAENANVAAALNASAYSGQTIWIGYQRSGAGAGTFFASDGTTGAFPPANGNPLIYQNWAGGEPNDNGFGDTDWLGNCDFDCQNGEQCVQIYSDASWNDLSCSDNSRSVIEVNLCPEITVAASGNNVCAGTPVTLTASTLLGSNPYQYAWSTNQFTPAITVSPATTTTYDVGVADRYSCSAQESVTVTVLPAPTATFTTGAAVCIGSPATITYTGSAAVGATYVWNFGTGVVVSGSGQGPYQVSWANAGAQNVTLQVTEAGCASQVNAQNVTVSASPTASFTFTTVCQGNPTTFTNTSLGNGGVIAGSAWDFGGGNTAISTDAMFTFAGAGTFPVTLGVVTVEGCVSQVTQQVTVNPGPTSVFSSTDILCNGDCDGTASAVVQGGLPPVAVNWSNGSVGNSISALCPGIITGTVSDANGCTLTGQVDIQEPAVLSVSINVTTTGCPGFSDGTATATPAGGTPPYVVDWVGQNPNAMAAGNYTVNVTDGNGCMTSQPFVIAEGAGLTMNFVITDNICFGGNTGAANLTVANGTAPYDIIWTDAFLNPLQTNLGTQGVASINGLIAGTYNVVAQDATGCPAAMTITITQPLQALSMTITPQDLTCFESGDGEILATQGGLSPYQYQLSDVFGIPISTANNAGSYTFQGLDIGIYFVDITDANGCTTTDAIELFEPEALAAESTVSGVSCFQGADGAVAITQITGGTTPYLPVSWNDPNNQVGNAATNLMAGTYTASITDANGCILTESFVLSEPAKMNLVASYVTDTCGQGNGAARVVVQLGTAPYSYNWKPDGISTNTHYDLAAGIYEVVVTDANGCMDSTMVEVKDDLPYPSASFTYRIEGETLIDQEVQFINNSIGTIQWTWNFGEGTYSNEEDPRFHYERSGDYLVQLLASNGYCNDTAYQYVNIDPLLVVYVPNAFTPGINGKNDYFFPQGEGIELNSYDMFIYDRWGKLMWQTGNFSKKWDGTNMFSLEQVPVGTYVYLIKFREFADLDRHVYKGTVTVIRD